MGAGYAAMGGTTKRYPWVHTMTWILGAIYFIWGITFVIASATDTFTQPGDIPIFTTFWILIGTALIVEGLLLLIIAYPSLWSDNETQIAERFNRNRWVRWGITQSLIFAALAQLAGFTTPTVPGHIVAIVSITFLSVGLAFAQSTNEALNCNSAQTESGRSNGTMYDKMTPVEGWVVAFLLYAAIAFALLYQTYTLPVPSAGSQVLIWVVLIVYLILHFFVTPEGVDSLEVSFGHISCLLHLFGSRSSP